MNWNQCFWVCTDSALSMLEACQGLHAKVEEINPQVKMLYCFLHRENLASESMSPEMETAIINIIQIVTFIK
jgi:hypothetical protein